MPQEQQRATFNNFSKGLVSDTSPLNSEDNTMAEVQNMELSVNGEVQRRRGFHKENSNWANTQIPDVDIEIRGDPKIFLWENVNRRADQNIVVVLTAQQAAFFDASKENIIKDGFINAVQVGLDDESGKNTNDNIQKFQGVSANGGFLVVSEVFQAITFFEGDLNGVTKRDIEPDTLQIRDIWGWTPKRAVQERFRTTSDETTPIQPTEYLITLQQVYERLNRGWTLGLIKQYSDFQDANGADPILWLPPLSSTPALFKARDTGQLDFSLEEDRFFGRSPSRGGSYIIDSYIRGSEFTTKSGDERFTNRTAVGGDIDDWLVANYDVDKGGNTPEDAFEDRELSPFFALGDFGAGIKDIGFFFGRFWYMAGSGTLIQNDVSGSEQETPTINNLVIFSKVTTDNIEAAHCFQEADPTSEFISDRLPTDGGTISIESMIGPVALKEYLGGVVVFANNGVWYISSGPDGFTPTSLNVSRLSSIGPLGKDSVVETDREIFFFSTDDIYKVTVGSDSNIPTVKNVSFGRIGEFYDSINKENFNRIHGFYDFTNKKIYWSWQSKTVSNAAEQNLGDTQLVYDLRLDAFTVNKTDSQVDGKDILGPGLHIGNGIRKKSKNIYLIYRDVNGDEMEFNFLQEGSETADVSIKFTDVPGEGGVESDAFFTLNHFVQDAMVQNQAPLMTSHSRVMETGLKQDANGDFTILDNPGSVLIKGFWDFTFNDKFGGNTEELQAYKFPKAQLSNNDADLDFGKSVLSTNVRLNGMGRSLQLKFSAEPEHDFHLYGMTIQTASNKNY